MLKKNLRVLYIKEPSSDLKVGSPASEQAVFNLENGFDVRNIQSLQELETGFSHFVPQVLLCSLESPVSPSEVLKVLNLSKNEIPLIVSVAGGDLTEVLPLLHLKAKLLSDREPREKKPVLPTTAPPQRFIKPEDEMQLEANAKSYRAVFYHSPIPYWIYDQETLEILDVNEVAINNYGYSREEFLKLNLRDLRPQEEVPLLEKYLQATAREEGAMRHGKFTHLKKDGSRLRVEVYGYRFAYDNRRCRLIACIDITEKEEAVKKLKQKQARLAAAEKIARIGYWNWNIPERRFYVSDMMYHIWGRERPEEPPTWLTFKNTIHPGDRERFLDAQDDSLLNPGEHNLEYRILRPTGETRWIHELGRVLTLKNGEPEIVERTVQDITEEKLYLEKLATSESRYRGIVKSQTNYLIRTDLQGRYTYCNNKFQEEYGWLYEERDLLGSSSLSSILEYHHEVVMAMAERCVQNPGMTFQLEIDKPLKDGGIRNTLWDFVCLLNSEGTPAEIQCVGIDISSRVQAEKELKDSQLRYQLVTEATSDTIWDWDLVSGVLTWGTSLKSMFGYDPEELNSIKAWSEVVHPEDEARVNSGLFKTIKGKENIWGAEYRLRKKTGEYAYVVEKGSILRDLDGKAYRLVGSIQDITEKKKLQDLLEKASTLSRIGSFELDMRKGQLFWSAMTREIHEVPETYIPEVNTAVLFYKEGKSRNRLLRVFQQMLAQKQAFDEELQITTARGRDLWVRVMAQPEFEDGKCMRVNGSFQDIDKIKRTEMEVLNAAKEKEILLESFGDAFFAIDEHWKVMYWNNHAANLLQLSKEKVLQKDLWDIFPEAIPFKEEYKATMHDRRKRHFETFFRKTDAWYEVTVYPSLEGLSVFFKDVTQRKQSDDKLRELNASLKAYTHELVMANKGLEQFSYIVSHNLRSPVANILGLAELLKDGEYDQEIRERFFSEIFSNVERLDVVIKDLNNILQTKKNIRSKKEKIDLKDLIGGISFSIQHLIKEENVVINADFEKVPSITTVKPYLYSIFYNLILNSIKYRRQEVPPVLEIRAITRGEFIIITFRDNGMGIDLTRKRDEIFGLYKRFHNHVDGKGMGLFMVKTQVEMLGGKINVDSQVNSGTTFTIVLKENVVPIELKNERLLSLSGDR